MTKILDILDSKNQKFNPGASGMSSDNAQDGIIEVYGSITTTFIQMTDTPIGYAGADGYHVTVSGSNLIFESLQIEDDSTPVLGGDLQTSGNNIIIQDTTPTEKGLIGYTATTDGVYFSRITSTGYNPADGGVSCVPGKIELHGTAVEIISLSEVGGSSRNLQITADGIVYAAELPDTGWDASATSTFDYDFTNGKTTGPWVAVTGLTINPVADVDVGDRVDVFVSLYVENVEDKPGTLEIGIGINGADPTVVGTSKVVAPESILYVPVSWVSTNHGGLVTTDTLTIFARRGVSTDDAHLYLRGTTEIHQTTISVPSDSGNGVGSPTDLGNIPGASSVTITSSTGGNTVLAGATTGPNGAGVMTEAQVASLAAKIEATDVTYENLDANGDVGSGVGQVEPGLGDPAQDGYVLSSTAAGARSWVAQAGGIPDAPANDISYFRNGSLGGGGPDWTNSLKDYLEQTQVTAGSGSFAVDVADGQVVQTMVTAAVTYTSFGTPDPKRSFTLQIKMNAAVAVFFPADSSWGDAGAPTLTNGKEYLIGVFGSLDGTTWNMVLGNSY